MPRIMCLKLYDVNVGGPSFSFLGRKLVNNPCVYNTVNINTLWCVIMCIYYMLQS